MSGADVALQFDFVDTREFTDNGFVMRMKYVCLCSFFWGQWGSDGWDMCPSLMGNHYI